MAILRTREPGGHRCGHRPTLALRSVIEPLTVWNRLNGSNGCLFYRAAAEVL